MKHSGSEINYCVTLLTRLILQEVEKAVRTLEVDNIDRQSVKGSLTCQSPHGRKYICVNVHRKFVRYDYRVTRRNKR